MTTIGATIIGHQGWADFFTQNALYHHYAQQFQPLIILTIDQSRRKLLEQLFADQSHIQVVVPPFHQNQPTDQTCIHCHQGPSLKGCPRLNSYHGLPISDRYEKFHLSRDLNLEEKRKQELFTKHRLTSGQYLIVHEDPARSCLVDRNLITSKLPIINLNQLSEIFIDLISFITEAQEIHLIDSSYSVMIYLSSLKYQLFQRPVYLHQTRTGRDYGIYQNPTIPNWQFV